MNGHPREIRIARQGQALPALVSLIVVGLGQWLQGRTTEALLFMGMWAVSWMNCLLFSLILMSRLHASFAISLVVPGLIQVLSALEAARYEGRDKPYSVARGLAGLLTLATLGMHLVACRAILAG